MAKRTLQIDVLDYNEEAKMMECRLIIDGRSARFYMPKSNYEAFMFDGVFIRDGQEKDSADVLNTTHVFDERI